MSALIQWDEGDQALAIEIDAATLIVHERTAEVSEHPVETGTAIADHVKPANATMTLEGTISNAPLRTPRTQMHGVTGGVGGAPGGAQVLQWTGTFDRVAECDALFAGLVERGVLVQVDTDRGTDENLTITRYRVDRDGATGNTLPITLELKRVRVVSTSRVAVPAVPRAQVPQTRAAAPATPTNTAGYNIGRSLGFIPAGAPVRAGG
jgi:hypothetical protein